MMFSVKNNASFARAPNGTRAKHNIAEMVSLIFLVVQSTAETLNDRASHLLLKNQQHDCREIVCFKTKGVKSLS